MAKLCANIKTKKSFTFFRCNSRTHRIERILINGRTAFGVVFTRWQPSTIAQMLEFAARHNIQPEVEVEVFDFKDVNAALDRLENGSPRYSVVLKNWLKDIAN